MKKTLGASLHTSALDRRRFLGATLGACAISPLGSWSMQLAASMSGSLTKEQRDSMTPSQVTDELKKGNVDHIASHATIKGVADASVENDFSRYS